ncbi:pectinesterase inhibitor 1-like [Mercurialis annua]|uniref:pectinesterase inhibitor 1-like n=1 Tax=Mercurialis annua TaxID=3986 RepID=UPI00215EF045|nr:pectinesterase inhibitor 1-like [Mercurialis annua]
MNSQGRILMFFTIFLSLIIFQSLSPAKAQITLDPSPSPAPDLYYPDASDNPSPLCKTICDKTSNPSFCMKTLMSDKRTSQAKDVLSLAKIALDLGSKDSTRTRDQINSLIRGAKEPFKAALKECVNQYSSTAGCFRSALAEVEQGDYKTANYDVSVITDNTGLCMTAMAKAKARIASVSKAIQDTECFSNIGVVVTEILDK